MLEEWLARLTEIASPLISIIALLAITYGVLEAAFKTVEMAWKPANPAGFRLVWMRCARWLIAGLTFQLGADILETSVAPTWDDIGQLAAIAAIRTFLNYFLEKDQREMAEVIEKHSGEKASEVKA